MAPTCSDRATNSRRLMDDMTCFPGDDGIGQRQPHALTPNKITGPRTIVYTEKFKLQRRIGSLLSAEAVAGTPDGPPPLSTRSCRPRLARSPPMAPTGARLSSQYLPKAFEHLVKGVAAGQPTMSLRQRAINTGPCLTGGASNRPGLDAWPRSRAFVVRIGPGQYLSDCQSHPVAYAPMLRQ